MLKTSSILDYQQETLCPVVWRPDMQLKEGVKGFLKSSIVGFFESIDLVNYKQFTHDILIGSSLATYFYTNDSDLDIKIIINVDNLRKFNEKYSSATDDEILSDLIDLGRNSFWLTQYIPGSDHPIDAYFYSTEEVKVINFLKYDSLYSMLEDHWLKEPSKIEGTVSPSYVLNYAKNKAQQFLEKVITDIEQVKRDSIDFLLLVEFIKTLPEDDLKRLQVDFETALEKVNDSVSMAVEDRDLLKKMRVRAFSKKDLTNDLENMMRSFNFSDENLVFKLMQRYGYMRILSEIDKLYSDDRISPSEVKDVLRATAY